VSYISQEWCNGYFQTRYLIDLGVRVQLGHRVGDRCPYALPQAQKEFTVVHVNGIHMVRLCFCACPHALEHSIQLLDAGWWPASNSEPRSAATMQVLRHFHILNLSSHVTPTDFYRGLERMFNGQGLKESPEGSVPARTKAGYFKTTVSRYSLASTLIDLRMYSGSFRAMDDDGSAMAPHHHV
jgi:hypothetical protein